MIDIVLRPFETDSIESRKALAEESRLTSLFVLCPLLHKAAIWARCIVQPDAAALYQNDYLGSQDLSRDIPVGCGLFIQCDFIP